MTFRSRRIQRLFALFLLSLPLGSILFLAHAVVTRAQEEYMFVLLPLTAAVFIAVSLFCLSRSFNSVTISKYGIQREGIFSSTEMEWPAVFEIQVLECRPSTHPGPVCNPVSVEILSRYGHSMSLHRSFFPLGAFHRLKEEALRQGVGIIKGRGGRVAPIEDLE